MHTNKVTILGSNGNLGHAAMTGFRDAGWSVTGLARSNKLPVDGTRFIQGDGDKIDVVRSAVEGTDVVVYGLHPRYDLWGNGRAEAQLEVVLDAMAGSGKTLMFPGNIYNYRADDRTVSPNLRQSGEKARGQIRVRMEQMLEDATRTRGIQVIIIRAGDFFGPENRGGWYDAAMLMDAAKGRLYHLADLDNRHSWAYLPDLGRAFATLAGMRGTLAPFENCHFAGHWVSHGQIMAAMQTVYSRPMKVAPMPWWLLKAMGLINPVMRDILEMRYLWRNEMELVDPRLDALLGPNAVTPFEQAVATTVEGLKPASLAA